MLRFFDPVTESYLYSHVEERTGRAVEESRANIAEARAAGLKAELRRMRGE